MVIPSALSRFLLPPRCPACSCPVDGEGTTAPGFCDGCLARAGELLLGDLGRERLGPGIEAVGAFHHASPVADAVRTVKRPGRHAAAPALGRLLWQVIEAEIPLGHLPRTWVPATPRAFRARGVDIPRLLAGGGAGRAAAPTAMLCRPRDRPDQTTLDARARRRNLQGAFEACGPVPPVVVCVDDVRTTGATLLAAGTALRAAGARFVIAVTLTVAGGEAAGPGGPAPPSAPRHDLESEPDRHAP